MSVELSEKFVKELSKFNEFMTNVGYIVRDINDEECEWNVSLVGDNYSEPGRNKLESFVKKLMEKYVITLEETQIEDAKLLVKEFKERPKEEKPKKVKKEDVKEKPKKVKQNVKEENPKKVEKEEKPKKVKKEVKKEVKDGVLLDFTLDTSDTWHLETLEYWTSELVSVFGTSMRTGTTEDKHVFEWKLLVNGDVYSIYDWDREEEYNEKTWYLSGDNESEKNIKELHKYIQSKIEVKSEDNKDEDEEDEDEEDEEDLVLTLSDLEDN